MPECKDLSYNRRYYLAHKAECDARNRDYAKRHKKQVQEYQKLYAEEHRTAIALYKKEWTKVNSSRLKEKARKRYLKQREKFRRAAKLYYESKRDTIKQRTKEWQARHPDKCRQYRTKRWHSYSLEERKARQAWANHGRKEAFPEILRKWRVAARLCYICGLYLKKAEICIDHVHPKKHGGGNDLSNFMPAHLSCNSKKNCHLNFPVTRPDLVAVCCG